jgi:hypothetical protein
MATWGKERPHPHCFLLHTVVPGEDRGSKRVIEGER